MFNKRDFTGSLMGAPFAATGGVPISSGAARAVKVQIPIPISLENFFDDWQIFGNGSERLKKGRLEFDCGASVTPTVAGVNGNIVIGGISFNLIAKTCGGTSGDVGNTW